MIQVESINFNIVILIPNIFKPPIMPKEITEFKQFLEIAKGNKAAKDTKKAAKKTVFIKKNKRITKFKIRKGKYLYTFKTEKADLAKRLADGLDNNQFEKVEIKKRVVAPKKK